MSKKKANTLEFCKNLFAAFPEMETDEELSGADVIEYLGLNWGYLRNAIKNDDIYIGRNRLDVAFLDNNQHKLK